MKITQLQKELILEMRSQDLPADIINSIMVRLKTQEHQEQMMKYLETTKTKLVPEGEAIKASLRIVGKM